MQKKYCLYDLLSVNIPMACELNYIDLTTLSRLFRIERCSVINLRSASCLPALGLQATIAIRSFIILQVTFLLLKQSFKCPGIKMIYFVEFKTLFHHRGFQPIINLTIT
jgi:hypothetical protein